MGLNLPLGRNKKGYGAASGVLCRHTCIQWHEHSQYICPHLLGADSHRLVASHQTKALNEWGKESVQIPKVRILHALSFYTLQISIFSYII